MKKFSLSTTLLALAAISLMVMTASSSGLRGRQLQGINIEGSNINAPNVKIVGVAGLLNLLNSASNFTNSTFDVLTLENVIQNVTDQGTIYNATVTLANDQGFNVSGVVSGTWDPSNGNIVFNVAPLEITGSEGEQEPPLNNTNTTIPVPVPDGYTWIPEADLPNNAIAQAALPWGIDALVNKAISQYKLPATDPVYNVSNLILAAYKDTGYGSAYIFWTNLTNALNYKLDANITVKYWKKNQNFTLAGYSFHSYGYPASAIVIPPPVNITNTTSNATENVTAPSNGTETVPPVENSTVTVPPTDNTTVVVPPVDNTTVVANSTNSTGVVDNSTAVIPIIPNNATNVTVVVNDTTLSNTTTSNTTTTAPTSNTTSDGYTIYTAAQLAADNQAQTALQYGANEIIQKGISQNKIPAANANYTVDNIVLAAYKKQPVGTYYKFTVNMTNVDHVHVDANLTILYKTSTKAYSLNGYWYHSYNYSTKALGNPHAASSTSIANTTSTTNSTSSVATNSTTSGA